MFFNIFALQLDFDAGQPSLFIFSTSTKINAQWNSLLVWPQDASKIVIRNETYSFILQNDLLLPTEMNIFTR